MHIRFSVSSQALKLPPITANLSAIENDKQNTLTKV